MSHLRVVSDTEASAPVRAAFDEARKLLGGVPDCLRVLAHDPRALTMTIERLGRAFGPDGAAAKALESLPPDKTGAALKASVALAAALASRGGAQTYANTLRRLGFDEAAIMDVTETVKTVLDLEIASPGTGLKPLDDILVPLPIEDL